MLCMLHYIVCLEINTFLKIKERKKRKERKEKKRKEKRKKGKEKEQMCSCNISTQKGCADDAM